MIWIAGNFGMALNIVAAAQYFIPWQTTASFWMRIGFAVLWIVVLNFMAFRGIDAGSTMLVAFGIIATIVVSMMIIPSFIDIPALLGGTFQSPFHMMVPFFQHQGISIIAYLGLSLLLISEAFLGFEVISYMANEVAEPKKLHKTLFAGLGISGVIMILYILSSLGTVNFSDYVQNFRPFAVQAFNTLGSAGQDIIVFGMYLVIIGGAAAWPITGSRLIKAMSADKLFLKHFAVLHPKHGSPYRAVYFQSIAVAIFAWFIFRGNIVGWQDSYRTIYMIYVILSLIVLSLIIMTVPILRKKEAHLERPFKAPLAKTGPVLIVILFLVLIINWIFIEGALATRIIKMALSFVLLGLPFYFFVEMLYSGKSIRKINEHLAYFALISDKLFFPLTIRNKILKNIGNAKGKKILEYGCAVGTLTQKLADKVGPTGRIYATDLSYKKVKMTYKKNKYLSHVRVHHHPHLHDFKLKLPKLVDGVISIGMLSYMQHPQRILKSLSKHVKKGGEIIFVDFDKFFYLIPNVTWIKNDKMLKAMFRKAGFIVDIERHRSLLWQHIIITGVKR
jgi:amino acid transporter